MELLLSEAPPDIQALDSLVRLYELGQLMPTPNELATIIQARKLQTNLGTAILKLEAAA